MICSQQVSPPLPTRPPPALHSGFQRLNSLGSFRLTAGCGPASVWTELAAPASPWPLSAQRPSQPAQALF